MATVKKMLKFSKGDLVSVVEEDDRRVSDYRKSGWKETAYTGKIPTVEDELLKKAIDDADASEPKKGGKKRTASDKKVNDAIGAVATAKVETEAVDDGLEKEGE